MIDHNAPLANDTILEPRTAPVRLYPFFAESDADLSATEGRIVVALGYHTQEQIHLAYKAD